MTTQHAEALRRLLAFNQATRHRVTSLRLVRPGEREEWLADLEAERGALLAALYLMVRGQGDTRGHSTTLGAVTLPNVVSVVLSLLAAFAFGYILCLSYLLAT